MACATFCSPRASTIGAFSSKSMIKNENFVSHSRIPLGIPSLRRFQFKPVFKLPIQLKKENLKPRHFRVSCESSDTNNQSKENVPFGYTRKDVIAIGVGIIVFGVALKYGLEFLGLDPLQSGNVVQLFLVLGLMIGWVGSYVFRVGNKEMTYVKQLKDYEDAVMQKRLEELPEAELEAMLAEIEEEKLRIKRKREKKESI